MERTVSIRSTQAYEASETIARLRAAALADIRARLGQLARDVDEAAYNAALSSIDAGELLKTGEAVGDLIDNLLHEVTRELEEISYG